MRYFLHIAYNGFNYRGWQRQSRVNSVQETLETILSNILKESVICYGCGRTDAQVHSSQYILHINVSAILADNFLYILNKNLPIDISCFELIKVDDSQHARYDAKKRTYDYYLHFEKDPFLSQISTLYTESKLNFHKMNVAVDLLLKYNDFRAFCITPDKHNHTICEIYHARLLKNDTENRLKFTITANRFLKTMIRLLVGALIDIGKGNLSISEFKNRLQTGNHPSFRPIAQPQGLHLSKVEYEYIDFEQKSFMSKFDKEWCKIEH